MIYGYRVDPLLVPTGGITANGGSISNKGIEITLNGTPYRSKNFTWMSNLNVAHNTNKITSLTSPLFIGGDSRFDGRLSGGRRSVRQLAQLLKVGYPSDSSLLLNMPVKMPTAYPQYVAADGRTITTTPLRGTDYHYIGNAQPETAAGMGQYLPV